MAFSKGGLTETFRQRRRSLYPGVHLPLFQEHTHPLSGARLVTGKIGKKPYPVQGRYAVGWIAPDESILCFYRNVETERKARNVFARCREEGPPVHSRFFCDSQANDVYRWQDDFQFLSRPLDLDEMKKVTGALAAIFNMKAPEVSYRPDARKQYKAEAILDKSEIRMYHPHLSTLIHEFAHLLNDQVNGDKWVWHGPGFMRTFLSVLSLFPDIAGGQDIERLARNKNIRIADAADVPSCRHLENWLRRTHQTDDPRTIPSLI